MEKTISDLDLEQVISRGVIKNLLISNGGRVEDLRIAERSNGAAKTTASNPSRMLLTGAKAREREVVRKGIDRLEKHWSLHF